LDPVSIKPVFDQSLPAALLFAGYDVPDLMPGGKYRTQQTLTQQVTQGVTNTFKFVQGQGLQAFQSLRSIVNWPGSEFRARLVRPNGLLFAEIQSDQPPIVIDVDEAEPGEWTLDVTPIEVSVGEEVTITFATFDPNDPDRDGVPATLDNCPLHYNPDQEDSDGDGVGDACDNCRTAPNPLQEDSFPLDGPEGPGNGIGEACEVIPDDMDGDGIPNVLDNSPFVRNPDQTDTDDDAVGDASDNCPIAPNQDQADLNRNGIGDVCEDVTPPVLTCAEVDTAWRSIDASVACTAADGLSGLMNPADANFVLQTSVPSDTETAAATTDSRTVCDWLNNCATVGPVLGLRIDKKVPIVGIITPASATSTIGSVVIASYQCSDGGSGVGTCEGSVPSGAAIDTSSLGLKTFTVKATDYVGNTSTASVEYTVVAAPTVSMVTVTPNPQQYSDLTTFTATLSPATVLGQAPATSVMFVVGTQTLGTAPLVPVNGLLTGVLENVSLREPTPFGTDPTGQMSPGPHTVTAVFGGINPNFVVNDATTTLTIAKEDAVATYTGSVFASTACVTCSTATVTLSATVQDISAVPGDPATDDEEGDIRHATVTFEIVETGQTYPGVPVGLVTAGDTKTGTATKNVTVDLGGSDSDSFTILVTLDGYYTSAVEQSVMTVAKPLGDSFITGGGYVVLSQSAGMYAGQPGTKNNFGFNVKYNRNGRRLQGRINTLVRNNGHVYQIKGNAMTSLATNPATGVATFNGMANIQDVTDPLNPISIDGNATLQVTMTDRGEPGNMDTIGITVWNKDGGLWFSNNWTGTATAEQSLAGGNVVVR
jgi:hypothetical protein